MVFDPVFFMYGEEADFVSKSKKYGAQPIVTSSATIIHYGGASEKVPTDTLVKLLKAKMLLVRRHFSPYTVRLGVFLFTCWPLSRYMAHEILSMIGRKSSSKSKQIWKNVWGRRAEWLILR